MSCNPIVVKNNKDSLANAYASGLNLISSSNISPAGTVASYNGDSGACLDCKIRGGTNVNPAFW